ncbi:hypothetical protein Tco_0822689 [Tanacetum coccineum]|uniref:Uncharacterized protein n=1 Tax=Tanacetum coccineum TaxID=301880 RepID=A0ABQ5AFS9_9ASTR
MSKIAPEPPNPPYPPNLLPPIDKSNEFTKSNKKPDKSLKPKKTTRTMNPEPKVTMKHAKLISGTSQVNVKKMATRSGSKECVSIVDEGMEEGFDDEEGMEFVDDVTDDGLVFKEGLGVKEVRDEVRKEGDADKRVFGNDFNNNVSGMFPELNRANLNKNNIDSSYVFDSVLVMPPPVESNPILNPELNRDNGIRGNSYDSNVQGMKSNIKEVGDSSGMKDVEMQDNSSFKRAVSFSNVVQGTNFVGDNKLELVPCTIREGRKVVNMDLIIEEGSKK